MRETNPILALRAGTSESPLAEAGAARKFHARPLQLAKSGFRHFLVAVLICSCLVGCSKTPPKDKVEALVRSSIAPHFQLRQFQMEFHPSGEGVGTVKFRGTLKASEDLYSYNRSLTPEIISAIPDELPDDSKAGEWISKVGIEKDLATPQKLADQKLALIKLLNLARQGSLHQVLKTGSDAPVSGSVLAQFEFGEWKIERLTFENRAPIGFPRSAQPDLPAEGTTEIQALATKVSDATKAYLGTLEDLEARADKAEEDATSAQEAVASEKRRQEAEVEGKLRGSSLGAFAKGTKYRGNVVWAKRAYPVCLEAVESDERSGTFEVMVYSSEDTKLRRKFSGTLPTPERRERDSHGLPMVLVATGPGSNTDKDPPFLRDSHSEFYLKALPGDGVQGYFYSQYWNGFHDEQESNLALVKP